ncbi:MAG: flagellar motor switch protein FliM [Candidatus Puniceispirillum sp.]|nr:flagellar motor switch protein FliM [Candidatus Pelagibacter sp.]MBA4282854.1 flagellar motor switch protein FliM [Candidatus Puniceispirillum sp.]
MQESGDKLNFLNLDEDIPEHELSPDDLLALAWEKSILESSASSVNLDSFLSDSSSLGKNALKELDQSEIDSLLGFGSAPADIKNLTGIDAILNKSLIYYERLPMMEVVFDRLLRLLSTSLRNFTSDNVEISLESMKTMRFGDYLNSIPLPAMIGVFKAEEWDNGGILVVDSSLIYSIVDVLLGGKRSITASRVEGRPYTTIERNLIEKLMKVFLEELKSAFEPVSTVNFNFERLEINPHFAMISRSTNAGILVRLHVEIDDRGGRISLMLPYATIEPVRELLLQNFMGEKFGRDSIWEQHLASQLWETDVEFNVRLGTTTIPLGEVLNWKAGDYLGFPVTPASLVSAVSGDHELFKGNVGQKNGRVALQIEENILQKKMDSVAS